MSKKADGRKEKKVELELTPEESVELQMILDRLSVQVPNGESFHVYLTSLRNSLGKRERLVTALLSQLSRIPSPVGFRVFQALVGTIESRPHHKMMRQVAYRFSQKGFSEDVQEGPVEKVVLVQRDQRKAIAHMMLGHGTLWFVSALIPDKGRGWPVALVAFFERSFEIPRVRVTESSNKYYRDFIVKIGGAPSSGKPCEIPVWHAARLYFDMLDFSKGAGGIPEVDEARRLLLPFYDPQKPPYVYSLMPVPDDAASRMRQINVEDLLDKMDSSWLHFGKEELEPYHRKLEEIDASPLVIPEEIKEERLQNIMRSAADALCVESTRLLYQRFFEEQALWLRHQEEQKLAEDAAVVAQHIKSGGKASENPVIVHLVGGSLQHYWPKEEDAHEEGEETEPFYQTQSGLFIPR